MSMSREEAEAMVAAHMAEKQTFDERMEGYHLPGTPEREAANAALRADILKAFGVTEQDLLDLDPDRQYERAKAAAEADRETTWAWIQQRSAEIEAALSAQFASGRNEALITTAHLVGCPECLKACPFDETDPAKVCRCGFDWGHEPAIP